MRKCDEEENQIKICLFAYRGSLKKTKKSVEESTLQQVTTEAHENVIVVKVEMNVKSAILSMTSDTKHSSFSVPFHTLSLSNRTIRVTMEKKP